MAMEVANLTVRSMGSMSVSVPRYVAADQPMQVDGGLNS